MPNDKVDLDKLSKLSEMVDSVCSQMDEMRSLVSELTSNERMDEKEYLKSSPDKRESYDKMKMMSRGK